MVALLLIDGGDWSSFVTRVAAFYLFAPMPQSFLFFLFLKRGMIERCFAFRLNCLYIQHLKYILFCCTLVSKCIRFYLSIKRHFKA